MWQKMTKEACLEIYIPVHCIEEGGKMITDNQERIKHFRKFFDRLLNSGGNQKRY